MRVWLLLSLVIVVGLGWGWLSREGPLSSWAGFALPLALLLDASLCLLALRQVKRKSEQLPASDVAQSPAVGYGAAHLWFRILLDGSFMLFMLWELIRFASAW